MTIQIPLEALKKDGWLDYSMERHPKCPHCGETYDTSKHDYYELYDADMQEHVLDCPACALTFVVNSVVSFTFSTYEQPEQEIP